MKEKLIASPVDEGVRAEAMFMPYLTLVHTTFFFPKAEPPLK